MKVQRTLRFKFGGIERTASLSMFVAVDIEAATGVGLLTLASDVVEKRAKIIHVAEIIRVAAANAGANFATSEILDIIDETGSILEAYRAASEIIVALLTPPKGVKGKKQEPAAPPMTTAPN